MEKVYFSLDIEATGRSPGKHSMLSIGACVVGDEDRAFYREIKPISNNFTLEAMRVGCLGLKCLEKFRGNPEYDPKSGQFRPDLVLRVLESEGEFPAAAMSQYSEWVLENSRGKKPVEVSKPSKFDGGYTEWYFDNYYAGNNPFGHSGIDMGSLYKGIMRDLGADCDTLISGPLEHNALRDAIAQSRAFSAMLEMIGTLTGR